MTTFISSSIHEAYFHEHIFAVFQFKHLIPNMPGLEIFKMKYTIFAFSKLTEILENLKFQFFNK